MLVLLALGASCKQEAPSQPTALTPRPAATPEAPPQIRTSELHLDLTVPLPGTSPQGIAVTPQGLTIAAEQQSANFISEKLAVTLDAPAPFLALSAKWGALISNAAKLTVSVRASTPNNDWSAWQLSSLDGDPRTQAGLFFFPPETKRVLRNSKSPYKACKMKELQGANWMPVTSPKPACKFFHFNDLQCPLNL
jgi:hypothetical protein